MDMGTPSHLYAIPSMHASFSNNQHPELFQTDKHSSHADSEAGHEFASRAAAKETDPYQQHPVRDSSPLVQSWQPAAAMRDHGPAGRRNGRA